MSTDSERKPVPVSLPPALVDELDALVEEGVFSSRSDALRYGARLVVREEREHVRLHELADERAEADVRERMERKRQS
ncbi:MAG: ribbon-helix-helix domain-containing protein [Halanaeroarchaeum sp.]